jgi:hypothetical protein
VCVRVCVSLCLCVCPGVRALSFFRTKKAPQKAGEKERDKARESRHTG